MSKFDNVLKRISEELPVPQQQSQVTGNVSQQTTAVQTQTQPAKPTTSVPAQQTQNPVIQALVAANTPKAVTDILTDPAHQKNLVNLLQKK